MLATPKFRTREFKDALGWTKEIFDVRSLSIVLIDALDRQPAEQIYSKVTSSLGGTRLSNLKKSQLVEPIAEAFFATEEVAFQVLRELDRASHKERHLVASIPEEQATERVGSYRAIALKRERAKFVWALARDDRRTVRMLANRIIKEFFEEVADIETARVVLDGTALPALVRDRDLAKRLQEQAERLSDAAKRVNALESKLGQFEEERAKLLAAIGGKERALKQESVTREELEGQLTDLRKSLTHIEGEARAAEILRSREVQARATAEDLAQKVRRLSKLAGASTALNAKQSELEAAHRRIEELERQLMRLTTASVETELERARDSARSRQELESVRSELHQVRQAQAERDSRVLNGDTAPSDGTRDRVVVLLDQANLAATASSFYRRKVNFSALLQRLAAGRKVAKAVAFVVDNGGAAFQDFVHILKISGWEVRLKKPKTFADGTSKADWDMGLAMEAVAMREEAGTFVIVSGDGDFAPLVRQMQRFGATVEVAAFAEALAQDLVAVADRTQRLGSEHLE